MGGLCVLRYTVSRISWSVRYTCTNAGVTMVIPAYVVE